MHKFASSAEHVLHVLWSDGIEAALRLMNSRVPHRYTAIFRCQGDHVRVVCSVDKTHSVWPEALTEFPLGDSFCQFVMRDSFLRVDDAIHEPLLAGSPYQSRIRSYHALSLTMLSGEVVGTVAHFDPAPGPLSDDEFDLLALTSRVLPEYLDDWDPWRKARPDNSAHPS